MKKIEKDLTDIERVTKKFEKLENVRKSLEKNIIVDQIVYEKIPDEIDIRNEQSEEEELIYDDLANKKSKEDIEILQTKLSKLNKRIDRLRKIKRMKEKFYFIFVVFEKRIPGLKEDIKIKEIEKEKATLFKNCVKNTFLAVNDLKKEYFTHLVKEYKNSDNVTKRKYYEEIAKNLEKENDEENDEKIDKEDVYRILYEKSS